MQHPVVGKINRSLRCLQSRNSVGKNFPTEIVLTSAEFFTEMDLSTEMGPPWRPRNFGENVLDIQQGL